MIKQCLTVVIMAVPTKGLDGSIRARQGARIRAQRDLWSMSQDQLAAQLDPPVTKAAVSEWENGKSSPRQTYQVQLAKALRVPWSTLFGLDGEAA